VSTLANRIPDPAGHAPADPLHAGFLSIMPRIEQHACITFRSVRCPDRRQDCVQEAVALAWLWFRRLAGRGKDATRFPAALAGYAARAVRAGRKLAGTDRAGDVLSPGAQARHGFELHTLSSLSGNPLEEALQDNIRSPVPDQAAFRVDFPAWLSRLGDRDCRLAQDMALGHSTQELARVYRVSPARVSQLRRELHSDWRGFHGEPPAGPLQGSVGIA
jgi:hypothetical protein